MDRNCSSMKNSVMKTACRSSNNVGRRFRGCLDWFEDGHNDCNFFTWVDPPMYKCSRVVILGLIRRLENVDAEIKGLKDELKECKDRASYQALLQKNLMYLAAIADAQPQGPMMTSQMAPHPVMQQGGFYMQHPQAAAVPQQPIFAPKGPLQFNNPHPMQELQQQQQMHQHHPQGLPGQMGMRPVGANNSMNPIHAEASRGGGSNTAPSETKAPSDVRGGNKQDAPEAGASGADGRGISATGKGSGDAEAK